MADDLSAYAPRSRFSDRAEDYVKFRPTYPRAAIDAILAGAGDPARLTIGDIGAGTGISSRLLADTGAKVVAIDPNDAMREAAAAHPRVRFQPGSAEATGLPSQSIDIVVCAQAFHWFEPASALAEFARILQPRGRVALMWNLRDESDAFTAAYGAAIHRAATDRAIDKDLQTASLFSSPLFKDASKTVVPGIPQELTLEGLMGRARSASYLPKEGPGYERLTIELEELHQKFADSQGIVRLMYNTELYLAIKKDGV